MGTQKTGHLPLIGAIACSVLIMGGGIYYVGYNRSASPPVGASFSSASGLSQVSFPASLFEDGKARYFEQVTKDRNRKKRC